MAVATDLVAVRPERKSCTPASAAWTRRLAILHSRS